MMQIAVGMLTVSVLTVFTSLASASPILHITDFIPDGTRTAFNGFESLPATDRFGAFHSADGITVEQINGDLNGISTTCGPTAFFCSAKEGTRAWYASGGDHGYTRITLAGGTDFDNVGLFAGNGYIGATVFLNYDVLLNGISQISGALLFNPTNKNYIGFSGGGFDEVRLTATQRAPALVTAGVDQALQIDSIEIGASVPEPASLGLLGVGLAAVVRRRRAAGQREPR